MSAIGKDPDLFSKDRVKYDQRRLRYIMKKIQSVPVYSIKETTKIIGGFAAFPKPSVSNIFEMGSGDSYFRRAMEDVSQSLFGTVAQVNEINIDLEKQPYDDNSFDLIYSFELIEHLLNPLFAMSEISRILTFGGKLMLTTCDDYSLIYKLEHLLERKYEPHFHQFNEKELRWLLDEAGFKINVLERFKRSPRGWIARFCYNSFYLECEKK